MANPGFDTMLNALAPFAQQMLKKHGEFYPFGATMDSTGQLALAMGYDGDEQPEVQAVIDLLTDGFKKASRSRTDPGSRSLQRYPHHPA